MRALFENDPDVADAFLIAAVYCSAIRKDESPRTIADSLFQALPATGDWPGLRDAILLSLQE